MSKRAQLLENEALIRSLWQEGHVFEAQVPQNSDAAKYFCTFPYPYMNGRLHIGHAFSASKSEFQARFQRAIGKNVLWPFALHCTGMPITACADKIKFELQQMKNGVGDALQQSRSILSNDEDLQPNSHAQQHDATESKDVMKHSGKKTKLVAKTGVQISQMEIMSQMGIPDKEIPKFADPQHWLNYFSPLAIKDMQDLGFAIDWRRTFITTDRNPYYNAFVKWQFNRLKQLNKLLYGCRPSILSRLDMQPCADHDRAEGEGAVAQEYTLVKLLLQDSKFDLVENLCDHYKDYAEILSSRPIYLVAATLRPETMYGQTSVFMLPQGNYVATLGYSHPRLSFNDVGVVEAIMDVEEAVKKSECIYISSEPSAVNMSYQGVVILNPAEKTSSASVHKHQQLPKPHVIAQTTGLNMFGSKVVAPLSIYEQVYVLPMTTISMEKGTGIVTCVPSDSPDDYCTIYEMRRKSDYFKDKYNVDSCMYQLEAVPIIDIPGIGPCGAVTLCTQEKLVSNKERDKIESIKDVLYKRGFYEGTMLIGPYKGQKVCNVKDTIRQEMLKDGNALIYYEPNKRVISRSGDICIVALCNQWYTKFGDVDWKKQVMEHVTNAAKFTCYNESTRNQICHVVEWLDNWACSRSYGLGTHLPWEDPKKNKNSLIESLSDSTIYMAYYTIAHYLQGDVFGTKPGKMGADAKDLSDEIFDYIFHITDHLPRCKIPLESLKEARREFEYWYPVDLRCSGKDLIFNHLTMSLFVHRAIWDNSVRIDAMPTSYFCAGHVLVNAEKMSKSKGNFLTVEEAINLYTADGTRVALADAGDGIDDANFAKDVAEAALLKLYTILAAAQADLAPDANDASTAKKPQLPSECDAIAAYALKVFVNEIRVLVHKAKVAYESFLYRDALKSCFYDYINVRKDYLHMAGKCLDKKALELYYDVFCKVASPIVPHICDYIWLKLLKRDASISSSKSHTALTWPVFAEDIDWTLHRQAQVLYKNLEEFRRAREKMQSIGKKKGKAAQPPVEYSKAIIFVAKEYPRLQRETLQLLQELLSEGKLQDVAERQVLNMISTTDTCSKASAADKKTILGFASYKIKEMTLLGPDALMLQLPYSELDLYQSLRRFLLEALEVEDLQVINVNDEQTLSNINIQTGNAQDPTSSLRATTMPAKPAIYYYN